MALALYHELVAAHPDALYHVQPEHVAVRNSRVLLTLGDSPEDVAPPTVDGLWRAVQVWLERSHQQAFDRVCSRIGKHMARDSLAALGDLDARDCELTDADVTLLILMARTGHFVSLQRMRLDKNAPVGGDAPTCVQRAGISREGALALRMDVLAHPQNWPRLREVALDHGLSFRRAVTEVVTAPRVAESRIRSALMGNSDHGIPWARTPGFWLPRVESRWTIL